VEMRKRAQTHKKNKQMLQNQINSFFLFIHF